MWHTLSRVRVNCGSRSGQLVLVFTWLAASCGGASESASPANNSEITQASTVAGVKTCTPDRLDCTSEEVLATVERLYIIAGATTIEAECLAAITGGRAHSVNEAFEAPTAAQTRAAIRCVGSEERLATIATVLAQYLSDHRGGPAAPPGSTRPAGSTTLSTQ